jgi:predicted RNA-binding Zn ribbon-like protein
MVQALDLDPGSYGGTYKLIGGTPVLDFANLVSYRGTPRAHDWLDPPTNLPRWAAAAGVHLPIGSDIDSVLELRELVARIFLAVADHETPDDAAIDRLGGLAADASAQRRLSFADGEDTAAWQPLRHSVVDQLALEATQILTSAETLRRVSACGECRWLYLDTTRNHNRRWCDPADCGNRARQRRHYHRTRQPRASARPD